MISSLLYKRDYHINDYITMRIPTVREIIQDEENYFSSIAAIISTPYDMMVQLDDIGIDFTTVTEWDLFINLFNNLKDRDLSLIFGDTPINQFQVSVNRQNNMLVLYNEFTGAVIDKEIYNKICVFLRNLLKLEKRDKRPANNEAKKFMIERARVKQKRLSRLKFKSQIEDVIVSLVNTSEFQYTYESVLDLNIYQLYTSFFQIIKKINYDNLMIGVYAGTVNTDNIDKNDLNWIYSSN